MSRDALHMTRDELNEIADAGGVAVVPTGSLEQHGAHLPVGTDSLLAETVSRAAVSEAIEEEAEAVVFPAVWTGFSPHHVPLGGTVSVRKETMLALLEDVCTSLFEIGFRYVLLVNGHGGNRPITSLVAGDLGTSRPDVAVGELSYVALAADVIDEIRVGEPGSAYHAGEVETALMLHLFSESVRMERARDDPTTPLTSYSGTDMFVGGPLGTRWTYDRLTDDGVRGEPTLATAENGEALFEAIVAELADLIVEFAGLETA